MALFTHLSDSPQQVWQNMFGGDKNTITQDFFPSDKISPNVRVLGMTEIEPCGKIGLHEHAQEQEFLFVLKGTGKIISSQGQTTPISVGSAILTGPFESHALEAGKEGLTLFTTIISY